MEKKRTYEEALHAMQAGVSLEQGQGGSDGTPKHLRVGLNACMCDHAALVKLLVKQGVIIEKDYMEAITDEMNAEVGRYEERLGGKVKLY